MALFAAGFGAVLLGLTQTGALVGEAAGQSRPRPAIAAPDPGAEGDRVPNVPELRRTADRPGTRRASRVATAPASPAPIRRADDTMVVCSVLLQGEAAEVTGGSPLDPGIARISGDGTAVSVVWSSVRIEGEEGQKRASCTAEDQQIVSLILDGEELLDGPQPY